MKKYILLVVMGMCIATHAQEVRYEFNGNLNDETTNARHLSIEGDFTPAYELDNAGSANGAWTAPNGPTAAATKYLVATGYKAIGGNAARTVTAWFKDIDAAGRHTIVSWGENSGGNMFNVMIENGKIRIEGGASSILTEAGYDDDQWHHLSVSFDPNVGAGTLNDVKIFVDAQSVPIASNYQGTTVIDTKNTSDLRIGKAIYGTGNWFKGALDDVRIYADVLTVSQIQAISGISTALSDSKKYSLSVSLYPNPAKDYLKINIEDGVVGEKVHILVSSTTGKQLLSESYEVSGGEITLDLKTLPIGVLIVSVNLKDQVSNYKIIKE